MPRGANFSIRDRLIVWNAVCEGITSASAIKHVFDDTGEREISEDSISKIIKEYDEFKRLLPEYPKLIEDLKKLIISGGIPSIDYGVADWKYVSPINDEKLTGKVICAIVRNSGGKTMTKVHAHLVIDNRSTGIQWIDDRQESIDIPPDSEKYLGIVNTIEIPTDDEAKALYGKISSIRHPQVMGSPGRNPPPPGGCWISTIGSLTIPTEGDAYVPAGEYIAKLVVRYDGNQEVQRELKIFSPTQNNELRVEQKVEVVSPVKTVKKKLVT